MTNLPYTRFDDSSVIVGIDEWNLLRDVPSFGHLLAASGLEETDIPPRNPRPLSGVEIQAAK
ncbi:MAG: hypothetical protein F4Y68_03965 [Boseongicola sp. SB0665_bin_10]|nr:hypothetical protein [Boseongicola sp. SB0665_bin_10]